MRLSNAFPPEKCIASKVTTFLKKDKDKAKMYLHVCVK